MARAGVAEAAFKEPLYRPARFAALAIASSTAAAGANGTAGGVGASGPIDFLAPLPPAPGPLAAHLRAVVAEALETRLERDALARIDAARRAAADTAHVIQTYEDGKRA